MGSRGASGGKYSYESVESLQRKLADAKAMSRKAQQDAEVYGKLTNNSIERLARRAKSNVTRANKTIDKTDREIAQLESAIEKAKKRKRAIPF